MLACGRGREQEIIDAHATVLTMRMNAMNRQAAIVLSLGLLAGFTAAYSSARAEETIKANVKWPSWRGPHFNGVADGENYPTKWTSSENVKWKIKLPGRGASTPAVVDDKLILTCGAAGKNTVVCLSFNSGETLWTTEIGAETAGKHAKATGANPSIATDGEHAYAYFKSGDLACLDLAGKIVWQINLQEKYGKLKDENGKDTLWWDLGNSPVLTKNAVVIALMHSGPSFLVAFDKTTGTELWKSDRNLDAPVEAAQSYTTPALAKKGDQEVLVTVGADAVTAHDASSGKELWQVNGLNPSQNGYFRSISSPVVVDGIVVAPYARGSSLTAIKLGGQGDVTKSHVLWHNTGEGSGADVPTPIAVDGKIYIFHDGREKNLACLDLQTGKELWSVATPKHRTSISASPIKAGDRFYVAREDGTVFVIKDGKIESENPLDGDMFVATPVLVDGKILLRTVNTLYCIQ
jgi:outer membrane protein assembly factor BamB